MANGKRSLFLSKKSMLLKHILTFPLILLCLLSSAQLERKPRLGAQIEYVSNKEGAGCKVLRIAGGTSEALKLQKDDIITKIGKSSFNSSDEFVSEFMKYKTNDPLELKVIRGDKKITLKSKVVGRPFEVDDNAKVIYEQANYKDGQLRVIINKPYVEGKLPAMLFIPGYTCSSIDNLPSYHPYKRIIDAYVDASFVTLRIEKSGLGDSKNTYRMWIPIKSLLLVIQWEALLLRHLVPKIKLQGLWYMAQPRNHGSNTK
jgi:uncharacterized protein